MIGKHWMTDDLSNYLELFHNGQNINKMQKSSKAGKITGNLGIVKGLCSPPISVAAAMYVVQLTLDK